MEGYQHTRNLILSVIKVTVTYWKHSGSIYYLVPTLISPFLVLFLLHLFSGKKGVGRMSKYTFYVFYPAHLLIICLIDLTLN